MSSQRLLQLRVDRRLGHEWDDWDGLPLPRDGVFHAGPYLYFIVMAGTILLAGAAMASVIWLVSPRLSAVHVDLPVFFLWAVVTAFVVASTWLALLGASLAADRPLLPARMAERGPLPMTMRLAERLGSIAGLSRDEVGNSGLSVFNRIAVHRIGAHQPERVLLLLPRCLGRDSMRAAIEISTRLGVPAFVASRGRYARQMIRTQKPSAVVAVACERDLVSGIADVGRRLPVLGSTLRMPAGPCRDTEIDTAALEGQLLAILGGREAAAAVRGGGKSSDLSQLSV